MSRARDTADQINRVNSSAADANAITVDGTKVGIGTTPSATYSAFSTIEFTTASITSQDTATGGASPDGNLVLGSNMNYSSGGGPEYKVTGKATQITQIDGNITLGVATSGTANTSITYNTGLEVLNDGYARAKNGLLFGTDTAAANALDDYEEGTFALNNAGDSSGVVASTGKYVKIGRQVTVHAIANVTTNFTSQAMDGLPFAPSHVTTFSSIHGAAVCIGANVFAVNCNNGTTRVEFRNTSHAATAPTTGPIRFTMVYQTT